MDPLDELRRKVDRLEKMPVRAGLAAVVRHLEMAQRHYDGGIEVASDDLFNDTVYRSNQAYEGSLKVAWRVLLDGDPAKKKTHQLEKGLTESGILTERTRKFLEMYRQEWRNPSTHDHELLLSQQDAFVAMWAAVVFATVLADQIIEHHTAREAEAALAQTVVGTVSYEPAEFTCEWLVQNLLKFVKEGNAFTREDGKRRSEPEVLGWLTAYLRTRNRSIEFDRHPSLGGRGRPDLVFDTCDGPIVVEVKNGQPGRFVENAKAQVLNYVQQLRGKAAILILAGEPGTEIDSVVDIYQGEDQELYKLFVIGPREWVHGNNDATE